MYRVPVIYRLQKRDVFSHTNPYISYVTQQCRYSYFELGLPVVVQDQLHSHWPAAVERTLIFSVTD